MKKAILVLTGSMVLLGAGAGCYNPELAPAPFLCGKGGACPDGYTCYGGICMDSEPECMKGTSPVDGTLDRDWEPNNYPDIASPLGPNCWQGPEDGYDPCECPPRPTRPGFRRAPMNNGWPRMVICPNGDNDFYKFWLDQGDVLWVHLKYHYSQGRDLDLEVRQNVGGTYQLVGSSTSTNDDEVVEVVASISGYYYIIVTPKHKTPEYNDAGDIVREADTAEYFIEYVLNPYGCNDNGTCDAYETHESCPNDCQDIVCGNLVCEAGETPGSCPSDCVCGNGVCEPTENPTTCPDDCPGC